MDDELNITYEGAMTFLEFLAKDDLTIYEEEIMNLPEDEQRQFFADNPHFMKDYPISRDNLRIDLLKDARYRGVLRKIAKSGAE